MIGSEKEAPIELRSSGMAWQRSSARPIGAIRVDRSANFTACPAVVHIRGEIDAPGRAAVGGDPGTHARPTLAERARWAGLPACPAVFRVAQDVGFAPVRSKNIA